MTSWGDVEERDHPLAGQHETFEVDSACPLCGWLGRIVVVGVPARPGRDFACGGCGAVLVQQAEAAVLLDEYARGATTLDDLVEEQAFRGLRVLYIGRAGPLRRRLRKLPGYEECHYEPAAGRGEQITRRVTNQDHQAFTFGDESFDLLLSSHVLEHVPDPALAFAEARRILHPGGRYIFSVPTRYPLPELTQMRAELRDGEVHHLLPAQYHTSPEGERALVFNEFGHDVVDLMHEAGLDATIRRPHRVVQLARRNAVFVARRV